MTSNNIISSQFLVQVGWFWMICIWPGVDLDLENLTDVMQNNKLLWKITLPIYLAISRETDANDYYNDNEYVLFISKHK